MRSKLLLKYFLTIFAFVFCTATFAAFDRAAAEAKSKSIIDSMNQAAISAQTESAKRSEAQNALFSKNQENISTIVSSTNERQQTLKDSSGSAPEEYATSSSSAAKKTSAAPSPAKKTQESGKLPNCTCNDDSSDYNKDVNNFLYDRDGNKVRRIYPACVCTDKSSALAQEETAANASTAKTKTSGWQIQY